MCCVPSDGHNTGIILQALTLLLGVAAQMVPQLHAAICRVLRLMSIINYILPTVDDFVCLTVVSHC